jgi:hypothetical protein
MVIGGVESWWQTRGGEPAHTAAARVVAGAMCACRPSKPAMEAAAARSAELGVLSTTPPAARARARAGLGGPGHSSAGAHAWNFLFLTNLQK